MFLVLDGVVTFATMRDASATPRSVRPGGEAIGYDAIDAEIGRLTKRLKGAVPVDALHSPPPFESGLVSLDVDDPAATVQRLAANDVHVETVPGPDGQLVRGSLHAFNTTRDVDQLLEAL